jgi:hypothetical protein
MRTDEEWDQLYRELLQAQKQQGNAYNQLLQRFKNLPAHKLDVERRLAEVGAVLPPEREQQLLEDLKRIEAAREAEELLPRSASFEQVIATTNAAATLTQAQRDQIPAYRGLSIDQIAQLDAAFDLLGDFVDSQVEPQSAEYNTRMSELQQLFDKLPAKNMVAQLEESLRNELDHLEALREDIKALEEEEEEEEEEKSENESDNENESDSENESENLEEELDDTLHSLDVLSRFFMATYPTQYSKLFQKLDKEARDEEREAPPIANPGSLISSPAAFPATSTSSSTTPKSSTTPQFVTLASLSQAPAVGLQTSKSGRPTLSLPVQSPGPVKQKTLVEKTPPKAARGVARIRVEELTPAEKTERLRWINSLEKNHRDWYRLYLAAMDGPAPKDLFMVWVDQFNRAPLDFFFKAIQSSTVAPPAATPPSPTPTFAQPATFAGTSSAGAGQRLGGGASKTPILVQNSELEEARRIREEQDRAFAESLARDEERERLFLLGGQQQQQQQQQQLPKMQQQKMQPTRALGTTSTTTTSSTSSTSTSTSSSSKTAGSSAKKPSLAERAAQSAAEADARRRCLRLLAQLLTPEELLDLVERYGSNPQEFSMRVQQRLSGLSLSVRNDVSPAANQLRERVQAFLQDKNCWSQASLLRHRYPQSLCDSELLLELFGIDLGQFAPNSPFLEAVFRGYQVLRPLLADSQSNPIGRWLQSRSTQAPPSLSEVHNAVVDDSRTAPGMGVVLAQQSAFLELWREMTRINELKPANSATRAKPGTIADVAALIVLRCLARWYELRSVALEAEAAEMEEQRVPIMFSPAAPPAPPATVGGKRKRATEQVLSPLLPPLSQTALPPPLFYVSPPPPSSSFSISASESEGSEEEQQPQPPPLTPQELERRRLLEERRKALNLEQQKLLLPSAAPSVPAPPSRLTPLEECRDAAYALGIDGDLIVEVDGVITVLVDPTEVKNKVQEQLELREAMIQIEDGTNRVSDQRKQRDHEYQSILRNQAILERCFRFAKISKSK